MFRDYTLFTFFSVFLFCHITYPAKFSGRCLLLQPIYVAAATSPQPRLLPGHRALAVVEGAQVSVATVVVAKGRGPKDENLYTLSKPHNNCGAKRTKSTFHDLIHIPLRLLLCAHPRPLTIDAPTYIDGVCGIQRGLHRSRTTLGPSPF